MADHIRAMMQKRRFRYLAILLGLVLLAFLLFWLIFARNLPSAEKLVDYQPDLPTVIRDYHGDIITDFARERRVQLQYADYPQNMINAFLAAEDKTFFTHSGLDYPGLAGAVVDYVSKMGSGQRAKGGSTITQQVAKNLLLDDEYAVSRKIREAILARRIEGVLEKEDILELYLNQIFLGRNAYGVQAASRAYFDKDVDELELHQAAFLAILPKGPANYRPERFADRAIERRNWVLGEMHRNGWITQGQMKIAQSKPLDTVERKAVHDRKAGGYFIEEVRRTLLEQYGDGSKEEEVNGVYSGGLWVRTSLNPEYQREATSALRAGLIRYDRGKGWVGPINTIEIDDKWAQRLDSTNISIDYKNWQTAVVLEKSGNNIVLGFANGQKGNMPRGYASIRKKGGGTVFNTLNPGDIIAVAPVGNGWALQSIPEISGGMVVQNPHNGRIYAMQGGFDIRISSFNRATQAMRQPGSTIKPFVYATALDHGLTPASQVMDSTFCVYQSAKLGRKCFTNFGGGRGSGSHTLRWGLEQSRNLMTVRAADHAGMDNVVKTIKTMGIGDYDPYYAYALGAGETTVAKLTNAYSMLVNLGRELKPTLIDYVQDRNGKVIYRADKSVCSRCNMAEYDGKPMPRPKKAGRQLMDPMTAYQMVHMMEGVVLRGTAQNLRDLNRPLFGKTGTTTGPTNVWFVGGTPDVVTGVYMGYDTPRNMGGYAQGGTLAAPIFKQFAQAILPAMPVTQFQAPKGIRMVRIDRRSGRRVYGSWPGHDPKAAVIWEAFKPETEPRRTIRQEELAVASQNTKKKVQKKKKVASDSEFLEQQGGIY